MTQKGGFKNTKLGKNIHRQIKRRGIPERLPEKQVAYKLPSKERQT